jgi:hypothetical protein
MQNLEHTLADYLRRIGQYEAQRLGGEAHQISPADSEFLRDSLCRQIRFSDRLITVAVILLCGLFVVGVFLILYNRGSLNATAVISGGTFASMLVIIRWLRQLWLDKSTMDMLVNAANGLSPAEAAKLVTTFYFKALRASPSTRP